MYGLKFGASGLGSKLLKEGYIGDYIGESYRLLRRMLGVQTMAQKVACVEHRCQNCIWNLQGFRV